MLKDDLGMTFLLEAVCTKLVPLQESSNENLWHFERENEKCKFSMIARNKVPKTTQNASANLCNLFLHSLSVQTSIITR